MAFCTGVGGHGGCGVHADLEARYQDIMQRLAQHVTPHVRPAIDVTPVHNTQRSPSTKLSEHAPSPNNSVIRRENSVGSQPHSTPGAGGGVQQAPVVTVKTCACVIL